MPKKISDLERIVADNLTPALMSQTYVGVDVGNSTSWKINMIDLINFIIEVSGGTLGGDDGGGDDGGGSVPSTPAYDPNATYLLESGEPLQTEDGGYLLIE